MAAADLVIGAVLIPGAAAPRLVSRAQLGSMKPGAAIVDVAIDQGGCFETSRPTTHEDPIYLGRRHRALLRRQHAGRGGADRDAWRSATRRCRSCWRSPTRAGGGPARRTRTCLAGLNAHAGHLTYAAVGRALGIDVLSPKLALKK